MGMRSSNHVVKVVVTVVAIVAVIQNPLMKSPNQFMTVDAVVILVVIQVAIVDVTAVAITVVIMKFQLMKNPNQFLILDVVVILVATVDVILDATQDATMAATNQQQQNLLLNVLSLPARHLVTVEMEKPASKRLFLN